MLLQHSAFGQEKQNAKDTTAKKNRNIFQMMKKAITRSTADSVKQATVLNTKSETPFIQYEGKIIRHIFIREYGFERTFTDTAKEIRYFGTRWLNKLHRNTREWVVRDNLFIKENTKLNPYIVADNERYLRSLSYIQDARIIVQPILNQSDTVDLLVVTKDLFSINGELNSATALRFKARVGDENVRGMGQSLFITTLIEKYRDPRFGYQINYSKNNIANTFVDASVGYSTIKRDLSYNMATETGWFAQLSRPLVSQYKHLAGSVLIGRNESHNVYHFPDSFFYKYQYTTFDAWAGYNLDVNKLLTNKVQDKKFVSIRYLKNQFSESPFQTAGHYNFRYDNRQAVLGGITFFKQKFYKTNYIYGFGTTEDMPYGYNVALTAGWYKQADLKRFYAGIDANKYVYTGKGYFIQYFLRTGAFFKDGMQDVNLLLGTSIYSKLFLYRNLKLRQYINVSYARQFNRIALDQLNVGNSFGVRYFRADSALGDERLSLYSETFFFLNTKIFGFKFSPFAFGNVSFLKPEDRSISKTGAYYGLGGGLRTHNENLVLQTVELRLAYFPRKINQNSFKLTFNANIRFKYSSNYVRAPEIIQVNSNIDNVVY